ncbi:MAG: hypothetical protein IPK60_12310 [Sandaracinaceae bacterium]|nr:hypothetical protein [Sandaracinaceae bacterium]
MRGWMNATRVGLIVAVCACAAQARAQAPATPAAQAASRVPLTTPAIQRFVTWLEAHPDTTQVSLWTDDGTMTALVSDGAGSLLCVGARNSAAACVRDPLSYRRLWRTGIRENAAGTISGVTIAAGPLPNEATRGVVVEFALPAGTVQRRSSVSIVAGSPPSTPIWMGQPFEDMHPATGVSSLRRGTPDVAPAEGPPWMADSSRLEIVPLNGDTPAIRVAERFSSHQAVCIKLDAGWRCARRDISLPETEGEESVLRVVDMRSVAPSGAPWWGIEYEWHHTSTADAAHGLGGTFVEVVQFDALPHLVTKFTTGSITWVNAIATVGGRRRFERTGTRFYRPWRVVGAACIEMAVASPVALSVDIDFREPPQVTPRATRRPAQPPPDSPSVLPEAPRQRFRYDGVGAFAPGDC